MVIEKHKSHPHSIKKLTDAYLAGPCPLASIGHWNIRGYDRVQYLCKLDDTIGTSFR